MIAAGELMVMLEETLSSGMPSSKISISFNDEIATPHFPNSRRVIDIVVSYYDLTYEDMIGKSREQRLAYPRQIAMYLLRAEGKCSFPSIGDHLGGRDHTTAMHACNKITELLTDDAQLKQDIASLREKLYSTNNSG